MEDEEGNGKNGWKQILTTESTMLVYILKKEIICQYVTIDFYNIETFSSVCILKLHLSRITFQSTCVY